MPELVVVAGPNGSGKSTLTDRARLARLGVAFPAQYINADDIARQMRDDAPELMQEERERLAFRQARDLRQRLREQRESYAFETVFSHPSTLLDMQRAQAAGYRVMVLFVTTADSRINWRASPGGSPPVATTYPSIGFATGTNG